jgi:hypothetical protein
MSDKSKFEQMLEKLVADDRTAAEEIFHEIVVEKSRSIYEGLLEDDIKDIEVDEASKEDKEEETTEASKEDKKEDDKVEEKTSEESKEEDKVEETSKDEEETTDESFLDVENSEVAPAEAHGGDATDDMVGDIEMPAGDENGEENGDDSENGEEEIEDRVVDLEDAIDDLKAEFEKMMGDKEEGDDDDSEGEEEKEDEAFVSQDAEGETVEVAPELGDQPAVESKSNAPKTASEEIREYVNKVSVKHTDGSDNSKSPVAGKNDMGGTASNIAKGGEEKGGKAPAPKEENAGNINVPGGKAKLTAAPKAKTKVEDDASAKKSTIGS